MTRSFFGRTIGIVGAGRVGRDRKAQPRRLQPGVDGLETRALLTGGSITLQGSAVIVAPDAAVTNNTVTVSYQRSGNSVTGVDVDLNHGQADEINRVFTPGTITMVYFDGSSIGGNETFTNNTSIFSAAYGGSGINTFNGGSGMDEFVGGTGTNTFNAGTGFDILIGGYGNNIYNESATGSGFVLEVGSHNTVNDPIGGTGSYQVF
jgi:Ca2+-binding RTX toxin-like protein